MVIGGTNKLPKSCVKILGVLNSCGSDSGLSQQQIIEETGLSERSMKYALKLLQECRLVFESPVFADLRRRTYAAVRK